MPYDDQSRTDTTTFDPGPLAEVACHGGDGGWTLVVIREFPHPVDQVWSVLTTPDLLRQWAPFEADRPLTATGAATLTMIDGPDRYDLAVEVDVVEAPTVLDYSWGPDRLRWELAATAGTGPGTRLELRHTVADRAMVAMMAAGWHLCLLVALRLLDGRPIAPIRGRDALGYGFEDLCRDYTAALADQAAG
jgi:uncharacterized protein YndB with AHSA1/START domain